MTVPDGRVDAWLRPASPHPSTVLAAACFPGALGRRVALDLAEQREERGHDLRLDVALTLDPDVLLERHGGVEDGHDLIHQPAKPREVRVAVFGDNRAHARHALRRPLAHRHRVHAQADAITAAARQAAEHRDQE